MPKEKPFHKEQILKGIMTLLILKSLSQSPMHGYSLQTEISSKIRRDLPQGTIYVLLKSLERRGLISLYETMEERDKKIYNITPEGLAFLQGHGGPLSIARNIMDELIAYIETINQEKISE